MASDKDTSGKLNFVTSPFDAIRHMDGEREFWRARELSKILGYNRWENFENVIAKAKIACKYNGHEVDANFREATKISRVGSRRGKRPIRDVELTRYACYILVQNADASKPIVAHAMDYVAVQTRRQELTDADTFAQLSEDEKRLIYRAQLSLYNRKLAQTNAMGVHHEVGKKVRKAIEDIGGTMPEDLAPEPSIKPLLNAKHQTQKKLHSQANEENASPQDTLWE
jgi:hypothetical protein